MTIQQSLNFIRNTLETVMVAAVKAIKAHNFPVTISNSINVDNLPEVQQIKGKVEVDHSPVVESLNSVVSELGNLQKEVRQKPVIDTISVKNFPKFPDPPKTVTVSNPTKEVSVSNLNGLLTALQRLEGRISKLPTEYPKTVIPPFPDIHIPNQVSIANPVREVSVDNLEILKSNNPKEYVPVRLSDGQKFYNALEEISVAAGRNSSYMKSDGTKVQALVNKYHEAEVSSQDKYNLNHSFTLGDTTYLGEEDVDGNWVVRRVVKSTTGGGTLNSFGFATNKNNPTINTYTGAWNNKTSLSYGRYSQAF